MNVCMHYLFSYNHNEDLLGVHYILVHYSVPEDIRGLMDALNQSVCVCVCILCELVSARILDT